MAISNGKSAHNGLSNGDLNDKMYNIPPTMKAIRYNKVKDWSLVTMPVPTPKSHEILIKGVQLTWSLEPYC